MNSASGDLAATTSKTGDTVLQLTTIHGDVALQLPLTGGQAPVVLDSDEYGNPRAGQEATRYNGLGAKQRSTETVTGLTLMGVRLYNPVTGRFLSTDPVYGGGDNRYGYPADPINQYDLVGKNWFKKKWNGFKKTRVGGFLARNRGNIVKGLAIGAFAACTFASADSTQITGEYDVITAFDVIHDLARPADTLTAIAKALRPGGTFLMGDIAASSRLEENIGHPFGPARSGPGRRPGTRTGRTSCPPRHTAHGPGPSPDRPPDAGSRSTAPSCGPRPCHSFL
ncbi:hypothetical protein BV881_24160 [Streptomyces sp. ZL-24]|uniref:RHS repeat-associated core domain-containing protein n=1 Tax=Streptomyces sp. ZL-24 TaxID=1933029 RepID=UPI000D4EE620|nr:RHS repeat-associated core domain-containing protein [Streptomyces sp. ZL-24]POG44936.1 hypothetical protein BV881_24160 [Streptomyces sp. ZL-24]